MPVWLDVTDASSVERAFTEAISGLGGIDVLINVAGGDTNHGTFEETTDEVWVSMIELGQFARRSGQRTLLVRESRNQRPNDQPCGQSGGRRHPSEHCRSSHDQDSKLGGTTGRSRSLPPSLPARTGRGT